MTSAAFAVLLIAGCSGGPKSTASATGETKGPTLPSRADSSPVAPANPNLADPGGPKNPIPEMPKPDPEKFVIPETGSGGWKSASVDGMALAKKVGSALASLKSTEGETVATIKTPVGNGQVRGKVKVQSPQAYSIQYLVVDEMPALKEARSNGKLRAISTDQGAFNNKKPAGTPLKSSVLSSRQLASNWHRDFPHLLFLGLTDKRDPWQPLLEELLSGRSGFETEVAERTLDFRGKKVSNFRVTAKRTAEMAKKLGPCEMEMVFDGQRFLPVTIRVNFEDPKDGKYQIVWQTGWNFQKSFKPEEFAL